MFWDTVTVVEARPDPFWREGRAVGWRRIDARQTLELVVLVGRERELVDVAASLASLEGGRGGLIVVTGEPGIGKTALCEEVAARASAAGHAVAWAACWRSPPTPPLWPWRQVVRDLLAVAGSSHDDVRALEPWLDHLGGAEAPVSDPEAALAWLSDAVGAVCRAAGRPVLVVIDDLQWADIRSRQVLVALSAQLARSRAVVVVSCRGDELDPAYLATLSGRAHVVALARLDRGSLGVLADEVTAGARVDVEELHRRTGGNPLFACELLRFGTSAGRLPDTVSAVLAERLSRLPETGRRLLDVAAVVGEQFTIEMLGRVAGGPRGDVAGELEEPARLGLVEPVGSTGSFRFSHAIAREAVLAAQTAARRWQCHEAVAEALESLRAEGGDVDAAALAHHFAEAGSEHVPRAVVYAREAARAAMAQFAAADAARLLERTLSVVEPEWYPSERLDLLIDLGHARHAVGDVPGARATFESAIRLARARGDAVAWARAALGCAGAEGFEVPVLDQPQLVEAEEAMDALGDDEPELRAQLMARLAVAGAFAMSEQRRRTLAEGAVRLARTVGGVTLIDALAAHCDAVAGPDHVEARLEQASEVVALAADQRDRRRELLGRRLRAVALLELGDVQAFDAEVDAFARGAAALRRPLYDWYVPLWRGARALMSGDLDAVEALLEDTERIGAAAGSDNALLLAAVQRWWMLTERDDTSGALAVVKLAVESSPVPPVGGQVSLALALANAGQFEDARSILDRLLPDQLAAAARDSEWLPMLCEAAEGVHRIGGHEQGGWLYQALLPYRDLYVVEGIAACCLGSVERFLAMLTTDAAPHIDRARAANRHVGATAALARTDELAPRSIGTLRCDGDTWLVGWNGTERTVRDRKGLHDIAHLVRRPHQELHVLDLVGGGEVAEVSDRQLDVTAVAAYRRRLVEIDQALDSADERGDVQRSRALTQEKEALLDQLRAGHGVAGRPRRLGTTATERARSAVTQRVRDALRHLDAAAPALAAHLRGAVHTGTYCSYGPDEPITWTL